MELREVRVPYEKEIPMADGSRILLVHINSETAKKLDHPNLNIYRIRKDGTVMWRIAHPPGIPLPGVPYNNVEKTPSGLTATWRDTFYDLNESTGSILRRRLPPPKAVLSPPNGGK